MSLLQKQFFKGGLLSMSRASVRYLDLRQQAMRRALAVCWLCGLLCGVFLFFWQPFNGILCIGSFSRQLWSRFGWLVLQIIVSLLFAWGFSPWALLPWAFFRSAAFSWIALGLRQDAGSGGWLLWPFLLYSDLLFSPFLLFLWFRLLARPWKGLSLAVLLCLAAVAAISLAGVGLVMPFGAFLIESI